MWSAVKRSRSWRITSPEGKTFDYMLPPGAKCTEAEAVAWAQRIDAARKSARRP